MKLYITFFIMGIKHLISTVLIFNENNTFGCVPSHEQH